MFQRTSKRRFERRITPILAIALLTLALGTACGGQEAGDPSGCLSSGPMLGPAEMTETTVWLQTRRPCRAQVRYWKQDGKQEAPDAARLSPSFETTAESDQIARFVLTGLEPGTRYEYEVYLDGFRVGPSYSFQTQTMWRHRADPPAFRLAIGSCSYVNDLPFDRPGKPYGGDYKIFRSIAAAKPDFMIWLGDNVYYREADWTNERDMRRRWRHDRALPEMQPLLGTVHHYAIWDDHDFGANDADRTYRHREASLRVFQDYWANPTYGLPEAPGVFTRFDWADVDFFLLDNRYHRSPNRMPAGPDKQMFGREQLQWLKESLAGSQATFKIVAGGNQFWNPMVFFEGLGDYPAEQKELLDFLRTMRIEGVVFLSGDRHHTELLKRQEPGMIPLYEFTSSPLTSGGGYLEREANNPARVPGTWVTNGRRNFGLLEVAGKPGARVLTLRTLDADGTEIWKHEIREGELRYPEAPKAE